MQKIVLFLALAASIHPTVAQVKQGKIVYERKVNLHRAITDESEKAMIPEFNTSKAQLIFSGDESIFKNLPEEADVRDNAGQENDRVYIHIGSANNEVYRNYASGKTVELRELGPKNYIIEDSIHTRSWKLEEGSKQVRGFDCRKATCKTQDGQEVIAWYAEKLASPAGPDQFGGLPGAILELDINNAEIVFTAMSVDGGNMDTKLVVAPTNGKKVSSKEFQKMLEDEFGAGAGRGGRMIRIINN